MIWKFVGIGLLAAGISGCGAQPELMRATQSGRPEATFRNANAATIRNELAMACAKSGSNTSSTEYTVACSKKNDSMRGMFAAALLGNACSSSPIERVEFTVNQAGNDVFVTARGMMQINKCFGEVHTVDYDNNNFRNAVQQGLDTAVARWESGGMAAQTAAPVPTAPAPSLQSQQTSPPPPRYEMDPAKRCDACARIKP